VKIIIGDIHACIHELIDLLDKISPSSDDQIIALGDIVDRGPDNLSVLKLFNKDPRFIFLKGNHERKHIFINENLCDASFSQLVTKAEMGGEYPNFIDSARRAPNHIELDEAILVHGFMQPGIPLNEQKENVLVGSTRGERFLRKMLNKPWYEMIDLEKPVVFGHLVYEKPFVFKDIAYGIDTGCCHGGSLTALILPDFKIYSIKSRKDYWTETKKRYGHIRQMNHLEGEVAYSKATELLTEENIRVPIQEIIDFYQRALSCKPCFADAHIMLGYAYLKQASLREGNILQCFEKARDSFLKGIHYNPSFEKTVGPDLNFLELKRKEIIHTIQ